MNVIDVSLFCHCLKFFLRFLADLWKEGRHFDLGSSDSQRSAGRKRKSNKIGGSLGDGGSSSNYNDNINKKLQMKEHFH